MTTDIDNSIAKLQPARTRRTKPTATITAVQPAPSKSDIVIKLLLRAKGATALELKGATAWQPHSVRAFLSGLRKKGRVIVREARKGGESAYRIVDAAPGAAPLGAEIDSPVVDAVAA